MSELAARVSELEHAALAQLDATLAGTAMCRVDGAAAQPAKHWEGRSSAMAQARRSLRRAPQDADPAAIITDVRDQWRAQLAAMGGESWHTYSRAGLEALDELLEWATSGVTG